MSMTLQDPNAPIRQDLRYSADPRAILEHAARLRGRTLDEILEKLGDPSLTRRFREGRGKSGAGLIVEACFGILRTPRQSRISRSAESSSRHCR